MARYEGDRFGTRLGARRLRRERRCVSAALALLPAGLLVLDCPVGIGRWVASLTAPGHRVVGMDLSPAMLAEARRRDPGICLVRGEAERLPMSDKAVDVVFSFALAKHLPREVLFAVLDEFTRIARVAIVCTVNIRPPAVLAWTAKQPARSRAITFPAVHSWAQTRGQTVQDVGRCHSPIGMERCLVIRPAA